jgi:hypothetical protein
VGAAFLTIFLHTLSGLAYASSPSSNEVGTPAHSSAPPGTTITRRNLSNYASLVPAALAFAIEHGLVVHVEPTRRIAWPRAYQAATEQYSGQVRLDPRDAMENYLAGLPFPLIDAVDPRAAVKIAYDWHWGPFIPPQVNLRADQKTRAWRIEPSDPGLLLEDDAHSDFRNEGSCDQITIVRYMHTLQDLADAHHHESPVEYKQRGDHCGPEPNAYIMIQYFDPARNSDAWFFPSAIRRWRRLTWLGGYPHQSCTYACASFWWEYVPPKTEAYTYKLIGEQPTLACLDASGVRTGIQRHDNNTARFGQVDCEVRPAWLLEMTPRVAPENILPARLLVDKETYLFLGAEFYRGAAPEALAPLWNRQGSDSEETHVVLTDDIYVPSDRPLFFLSLNMDEESNVVDYDPPPSSLFNPRAQRYEPH